MSIKPDPEAAQKGNPQPDPFFPLRLKRFGSRDIHHSPHDQDPANPHWL
jgi:hypothetical protein